MVVNALHTFRSVTGSKKSITTFRKQLTDALARRSHEETPSVTVNTIHKFEKKEGKARNVRKYCIECCSTNGKTFGRTLARKQSEKRSLLVVIRGVNLNRTIV